MSSLLREVQATAYPNDGIQMEVHVLGELRKRMERCRRFGDVTLNGLVFDHELAGPGGASYELFREPKHTDEDVELAKSQLHRDHDVVSVSVTEVSEEELAAPIPPDPVRSRPVRELERRPFHTILHKDVVDQQIFFQEKLWGQGAFRTLGVSDVGRRLILAGPDELELETYEQLMDRTAAFTEFPRGADVARLRVSWKWAGGLVKVGDYGFIDGGVREEYLTSVQITFNSVPFVDESFCSASGGPGSIATPISELKPTDERVALLCWRWSDGRAAAHNGAEYMRVCRVWDWYPA
jgi:hypothetical protein